MNLGDFSNGMGGISAISFEHSFRGNIGLIGNVNSFIWSIQNKFVSLQTEN